MSIIRDTFFLLSNMHIKNFNRVYLEFLLKIINNFLLKMDSISDQLSVGSDSNDSETVEKKARKLTKTISYDTKSVQIHIDSKF